MQLNFNDVGFDLLSGRNAARTAAAALADYVTVTKSLRKFVHQVM
jgi:hypothetical protein